MSYEGPSLEGICRTHMSHVCMPPGPTCIGHLAKLYERKDKLGPVSPNDRVAASI